jgi:hypothetical protein
VVMKDPELFELCKEVEKRTGWGQYGDEGLHYFDSRPVVPLYTSDYLLQKLPKRTERIEDTAMLGRATNNNGWSVVYRDVVCLAETPLKALLKLVIALADAKELK